MAVGRKRKERSNSKQSINRPDINGAGVWARREVLASECDAKGIEDQI